MLECFANVSSKIGSIAIMYGFFLKMQGLTVFPFSGDKSSTAIHILRMIECFNKLVVPLGYVLYIKVKVCLDEKMSAFSCSLLFYQLLQMRKAFIFG